MPYYWGQSSDCGPGIVRSGRLLHLRFFFFFSDLCFPRSLTWSSALDRRMVLIQVQVPEATHPASCQVVPCVFFIAKLSCFISQGIMGEKLEVVFC